jgi:hypothetical protein
MPRRFARAAQLRLQNKLAWQIVTMSLSKIIEHAMKSFRKGRWTVTPKLCAGLVQTKLVCAAIQIGLFLLKRIVFPVAVRTNIVMPTFGERPLSTAGALE